MFESESNWSEFNFGLIDCIKTRPEIMHQETVSACSSCGSSSINPPSDHFFQVENMVLCEECYLDYSLMKNN